MSAIFYAPLLHREFALKPLPPHVAFMNPGIEMDQRASSPAEKAFCAPLPLTAAQGAAVLAEMLALGETMPRPDLSCLDQGADQAASSLPPDERAALEAFTRTGEARSGGDVLAASWISPRPTGEHIRRELVACQKTLLLAWFLEERTREIRALQDAFREKEQALRAALGEGEKTPFQDGGIFPPEDSQDRPWRMILDAALPFLPPRALLFTDDPAVAGDLREAGMLQPLPEDKGAACEDWPQEFTAGLLWVRLPAWRLVGRRTPLTERPWLEREVEMLVARPAGGWAALCSARTAADASSRGKKAPPR